MSLYKGLLQVLGQILFLTILLSDHAICCRYGGQLYFIAEPARFTRWSPYFSHFGHVKKHRFSRIKI
jgi:hypothetical protein